MGSGGATMGKLRIGSLVAALAVGLGLWCWLRAEMDNLPFHTSSICQQARGSWQKCRAADPGNLEAMSRYDAQTEMFYIRLNYPLRNPYEVQDEMRSLWTQIGRIPDPKVTEVGAAETIDAPDGQRLRRRRIRVEGVDEVTGDRVNLVVRWIHCERKWTISGYDDESPSSQASARPARF